MSRNNGETVALSRRLRISNNSPKYERGLIMTREQYIAKMAQLRSETEALVKSYNEAIQDGKLEEAIKSERDMDEKINEYTSIAQIVCFEDCRNTEDPMLTAVKALTYMTISVKDEQKGDDKKIAVRSLIDKERQIDLLKLDKYCNGIGANKSWMYIVQKMNFLLTAQKAVDLGIDPKSVNDSYAMSDIAREFDMGKNPTSKTNLLKTLQMVIEAMLGTEYKATSHDVNFLMSIYAKKNRKALTVSCANHRHFRNYIMEVCHRIVTGKTYNLEYKVKKDN